MRVADPAPRGARSLDMVDWGAVLAAPREDVVDCIRCRGMARRRLPIVSVPSSTSVTVIYSSLY